MEDLKHMKDSRLDPAPPVAEDMAQGVGSIIDYKKIIEEAQLPMYNEATTVAIKNFAEKSLASAEIIFAGPLSALAPDAKFTGKISLKEKLESGKITAEELAKAKEILTECYGPVSPNAAMRCGDGRGEEGTEELSVIELIERELGPQAMGASQTHAMAGRMVSEPSEGASLEADLTDSRESIVATRAEIGLHTDDHEHGPNETGCGALNGTEAGVNAYNNDIDKGATQLAGAIVGDKYSNDAHNSHKTKALKIPATYASDNVNLVNAMAGIGKGSKQVYVKSHDEVLASVNNVPGTTFNRELYIRRCQEEIGKIIQAFNIDAWHFDEVAERRFSNDPRKQTEYITACADWQARPALNLTDGSLEVVVRVPKTQL